MWLVFHEYETFQHTTPLHAWSYVDSAKTKEEAAKIALEMNFKTYCESLFNRFPPNHARKNPTSQSDKHKIVSYILKNIQEKSTSENTYYGIGYFIIEEKQFNLKRAELKSSPHITDIKQYLIRPKKEESDKESTKAEAGSGSDNYDYDSEYDTEEEECYDSYSEDGSGSETEIQLESDYSTKSNGNASDASRTSNVSNRSKTSHNSNTSRTSYKSEEGDISIYSD